MNNKSRMLAVAAFSALGLGMASNAHATAYSVAYAGFQNGTVLFTNPGNVSNVIGLDTSTDSASMTGAAPAGDTKSGGGTSGNPLPDANPACVGAIACVNNSFTPLGISGTNYSRGDAVVNADAFAGGLVNVQNIAESNVTGDRTASALGENSSNTQITFTVGAGGGSAVDMAFTADPYLQAIYTGAAGGLARAKLTFTITITDPNNNIIFTWAPDGSCPGGVGTCTGISGSLGGNVLQSDYNLQLQAQRLSVGSQTIDPTGDASFTSTGSPGSANCAGLGTLCTYHAVTNALGAGTYTLAIVESKTTNVTNVPEPQTIALLGLGLAGIGFMGRRRGRARTAV